MQTGVSNTSPVRNVPFPTESQGNAGTPVTHADLVSLIKQVFSSALTDITVYLPRKNYKKCFCPLFTQNGPKDWAKEE